MPGRKRKKLSRSNNGQSESKGSPKLFMEGDPIFCLMDMGVWWPGFVLDVCANGVVSVAFWNENSIVKRSLSKLVKFDKNSSLIISCIEKLEKKKRHSLIKKYKDDLCFASSAELSSDTSIPSGDSTSLVSEESMTVQSSVASMDATVPCTRTAEETSGMVCSATVSMSVDEANMALRSHLTDFEKMLLKTQDLVEIRGKTGRGVPVLIPNETEYLSDPVARQRASIRPENNYMFANTGRTVVRAGESLDQVKFRSEVELRFYANNLRKHTATIAQALNLNDTEMKYICNHLGHTQKVHDLVYRQTSGVIERLDIAKLMLIQEFNVAGKYQNKKLSEIQFDELGTLERKIQDQDQEQQDTENAADQGKNVDNDIDIEDDFTVCRKKAKKSERVRWSPAEEEEIKKYFSRYFEGHFQKKCPSREHCLDALKKSKENGGTIFKRKWETLKIKVSNMLVKIQV